ncbi:MAG TPA: citrate/2-methylcitrate synthase [Candidatus Baltobacteraceae bacterium]|jgi:citrate synthase|nr:citrate/2-methylcitrate synthase [Candidatus Baltobacteraceae bacterium]
MFRALPGGTEKLSTTGIVVDRGLEGVVVGKTLLSNVEGKEGRLTFRGYDIHDLAPHACFEEVVHLLLYGTLPDKKQLSALKKELGAHRMIPEPLINAMERAPKDAWPMDVLRTIVSGLALFTPVDPKGAHVSDVHVAIELVAKVPTIVAMWDRIRRGLEPVEPRTDLSQAANFLYMSRGQVPPDEAENAMDTYLVLLADHSYNASTFSARVTASTKADLYAAVTSAIATLQGEAHGGAASAVGRVLLEIGKPERAETYVREVLARGERIMGMGHREYKVRDPRAGHLEAVARQLSEITDPKWYRIARALEDASNKVLQETKPDKRIYANVDFYSAPLFYSLGFPGDEFTPIFACGRIAGWAAHILEQLADNRLIRPQATYSGPPVHPYEPIEDRRSNGSAASRS